MHRNEWKHNNPNPVGHYKSSAKGKVHRNTGIPQETRETSNKQPNFTSKAMRKRRKKENPKISRRKKRIIKIRVEINEKETKETIAKNQQN